MSYVLVSLVALLVAGLTLFSGFGLGTLLMPVFAVFFPVELAVAATAVVHLANNVFKVVLVGRWADRTVAVRFAVPAAGFAMLGALALELVAGLPTLTTYRLGGRQCEITAIKLAIAGLIAAFTLLELLPGFQRLSFDRKYVFFGGALSGFFGGLSGHQGALRTAFLIRCGLDKNAFLGTTVVSAVVVDIVRLCVYGAHWSDPSLEVPLEVWGMVLAASLSAFVGSFVGARVFTKVTMDTVHRVVGVLILLLAGALAAGVV
jgi:uncharacterized membrane protein YfcA